SASASFGENNKSKPIGYRAQQIRLHFSDEESPIYGNISIGEVAPVRQNNEQLISKKKISKSPVRSERRKSKSSAFYSCEEILSSENLCMGEWSSEAAECITLLPTKQNSNFQTSKELEEPSCSISFENNLSDSIKVLRVDLQPQPSKPADCKLDEETETYPHRAVVENRMMLRNESLHVTGMFRQMLRLRKLLRILKNKVANFFDGDMCHSPRQLGPGTGILGRLDNSRQFMRILPSRGYNRCRGSGPHASRPELLESREDKSRFDIKTILCHTSNAEAALREFRNVKGRRKEKSPLRQSAVRRKVKTIKNTGSCTAKCECGRKPEPISKLEKITTTNMESSGTPEVCPSTREVAR
ncbi:hypothetical protein NPIL_290901, partial [Nephila pilipes]